MFIKLFFAEDDVQVSEAPVTTNAVTFILRADLDEEKEVRLYAMADDGYEVDDVEVQPVGDTADKWALAPDAAGPAAGSYGDWGAKIELGTVGYDAGKIYFWAKAKAISSEIPVNDTEVVLDTQGIARAV